MFRPFVRFRHYKVICLSFFFHEAITQWVFFIFFFRLTFLVCRSETIQSRQLVGVCLCPSTCADISCHMFARLTFMTCGRYEFISFYFIFVFFFFFFHFISCISIQFRFSRLLSEFFCVSSMHNSDLFFD